MEVGEHCVPCLCSRTANFHDFKGQLCGPLKFQETEMEAWGIKLHTGPLTCSGTGKAWDGQVLADNLVSE